jgi:hypothetical protein
MITESLKRILKRIRSDKIQNKIGAGKLVYFLNPLEEIAFKYVPGDPGKPGKYYAKYFGQNEIEMSFDSTSILMGVMEGKPISRARYNHYHLGGIFSDKDIKNSSAYKVVDAYCIASEWLTREFKKTGS